MSSVLWLFIYLNNVVSEVKDLSEALQADAGFGRVRLTGGQWLRSRSRVSLWFLELNSVTKHPASLTFCPYGPCRKTLAECAIIFPKNQHHRGSACSCERPFADQHTSISNRFTCVLVFVAMRSQLNNLILCIADSNSEEARKDTLSYSA